MKEITLREHLKKIARKRWAGKSKEERSAHGKRMVEARERKRFARKVIEAVEDLP